MLLFFLCIINSNSQMNYLSKVNFQKWRINDSTKKNLSLFLPALGSQNVSDTLFQYEVTICLITFFIFIFVPIKCLHRLKLVCLFIFMVSKHLNRQFCRLHWLADLQLLSICTLIKRTVMQTWNKSLQPNHQDECINKRDLVLAFIAFRFVWIYCYNRL